MDKALKDWNRAKEWGDWDLAQKHKKEVGKPSFSLDKFSLWQQESVA